VPLVAWLEGELAGLGVDDVVTEQRPNAALDDPELRLRAALGELYDWFERGEEMLEKTTRDVATVPALRPAMEGSMIWTEAAAEALMRGRRERGARRRRVRAAIGHALSFPTWRSLVREQGLGGEEAVALMRGLVATA